jgi:hypothetical protein
MFEGVYQTPTQAAADRANQATRSKLERSIDGPMKMDKTPFDQVIAFLQDRSGLSFSVNWKALADAGVDRGVLVNLNLPQVPFRRTLRALLNEIDTALDFAVEDGVVLISTRDELLSQSHLKTRVYDVRPLVGSSSERAIAITDLIKTNVQPETWRDPAGGVGAIREFNGLLTVTTTSTIHHEISELLGTMAEADAHGSAARFTAGTFELTPSAGAGNLSPFARSGGSINDASSGIQLANSAMNHASSLLGSMLTTLASLTETRMRLEQDRAALLAGNQAKPADLRVLEARLETVNQQLEAAQKQLGAMQSKDAAGQPPPEASKAPRITRTFDVRFLLGAENAKDPLTADQRGNMEDLVRTLKNFSKPGDTLSGFNGNIVVEASESTVARLQSLIEDLSDRERSARAAVKAQGPR